MTLMLRLAWILAAISSCTAKADEWPAPRVTESCSDSGEYCATIYPEGYEGAIGVRAEIYRKTRNRRELLWKAELSNVGAPTDVVLAADGCCLVVFGDWGREGFGSAAIAFYSRGRQLSTYALEELFTKAELERFPRSVTSRWWRYSQTLKTKNGTIIISLACNDRACGEAKFNYKTGAFVGSRFQMKTPKSPIKR